MSTADVKDIATACSTQDLVSTLGVVVDKVPPYHTKGSSSCVIFTIKDSDLYDGNWRGGLKIKYFNDHESHLPRSEPEAVISQRETIPWAIFRSEANPNESLSILTGPVPFEPTALEKRLANALLARTRTASQNAAPQPVPRERQKIQNTASSQVVNASVPAKIGGWLPVTLLQDLQPGRLTQLLGQVVKLNTFDTEKTIVYLTDYTSNESLMNIEKRDNDGTEGDSYNYLSRSKRDWPGPWGQLTIRITLWEPHAGYARERLKPGDLVLFTYTHVKAYDGMIEAVVHRDKKFGDKVHIRQVASDFDDRTRELMVRRKEYWKIHGTPKEDPKEKGKMALAKESNKKESRREEGQRPLPGPTLEPKLNKSILTNSYSVPPKSIDSILSGETHMSTTPGGVTYQLPFQNFCYRPIVRVVDYFPPNVADFAVQVPNKSIRHRGKDPLCNDEDSPKIWEWRFCLLIEGVEPLPTKMEPRAQMKLFVSGAGGEFLLNDHATDLRGNPRKLAILKEKLFILWGNLLEVKQRAAAAEHGGQVGAPTPLSSMPFACCVKEYGVRCAHPRDPDAMEVDGECSQANCFGWERRFAMFGTTIHS
ncbi:hypothetical protein N7492_006267 [Penicillium capsulatum]|uniref:Protection of telomeres protein 1 n=1 Tax=Penicillium capsulatum TaxID=69766 RepID=A0A9W9LMD1_9EURO|nr:hypothetical protein N7492_006267 [Penicillium capsulatum]